MAINGRQAAVFASGIALGAAAAAWFAFGGDADATKPSSASTSTGPSATVAEGTRCEFEPAIKAAASEDGTSRIPADLTGRTAAGVPPLLVTGKESAAAGRARDAEVAF